MAKIVLSQHELLQLLMQDQERQTATVAQVKADLDYLYMLNDIGLQGEE